MVHYFACLRQLVAPAAVATALLAAALLATACSGSVVVGENGVGSPVDVAVEVPGAQTTAAVALPAAPAATAEPAVTPEPAAPEPATPEPMAADPATPEPATPEPVVAEASGWSTVFENTAGPAPLIATGTGGSCPDADFSWENGFDVAVYLRDVTDVFTISSAVIEAPVVGIIETMPSATAWERLSDQLSTTDAIKSLTPESIQSGFGLTIYGYDGPAEEQLSALVDTLRNLPSVLVITDTRCTDNAVAELIAP